MKLRVVSRWLSIDWITEGVKFNTLKLIAFWILSNSETIEFTNHEFVVRNCYFLTEGPTCHMSCLSYHSLKVQILCVFFQKFNEFERFYCRSWLLSRPVRIESWNRPHIRTGKVQILWFRRLKRSISTIFILSILRWIFLYKICCASIGLKFRCVVDSRSLYTNMKKNQVKSA